MRVNAVTGLKKNQIAGFHFEHGGVLVSRTGYTGEDGFEITGSDEAIRHVWDVLLAAGQPFGIKPCGLGARDTLRTEVCYPLYGHELDEDTTPIEAGLGFLSRSTRVNSMALRSRGTKSQRHKEKTCCVQDGGEIRAAAAAISDLGERRERRRRHQRHAKPVARHRHWHGLRAGEICENPIRRSKLKSAAKRFTAVVVPKRFTKEVNPQVSRLTQILFAPRKQNSRRVKNAELLPLSRF